MSLHIALVPIIRQCWKGMAGSRPSPNRSMKKVSELKEKGFQTDGNQREPPPYSVVKKEVEDQW